MKEHSRLSHIEHIKLALSTLKRANCTQVRTWIYQEGRVAPGDAERDARSHAHSGAGYNVHELVDPLAKQDELETCPVQPCQHYLKGDRRGASFTPRPLGAASSSASASGERSRS